MEGGLSITHLRPLWMQKQRVPAAEPRGLSRAPLTLHGPISLRGRPLRFLPCPPLRLPLQSKAQPWKAAVGAVWLRLPTGGSSWSTSTPISQDSLTILITGELFTR